MSEKYEPMRQVFEEVDRRINRSRWVATAIILEVDKEDRTVKAAILPEWQETGWVKVYMLNSGSKYLSGPLPEVDSEVVCLFLGADPNTAFILSGGFLEDSEEDVAKINDDYAFPIMDKYGNSILLDTKGITIIAKENLTIAVSGNADINVDGTTKVNSVGKATIEASTIELGEGAAESVIKGDAFKTAFDGHTHPTPMGPSGPPVLPMPPTTLSTKVKTV